MLWYFIVFCDDTQFTTCPDPGFYSRGTGKKTCTFQTDDTFASYYAKKHLIATMSLTSFLVKSSHLSQSLSVRTDHLCLAKNTGPVDLRPESALTRWSKVWTLRPDSYICLSFSTKKHKKWSCPSTTMHLSHSRTMTPYIHDRIKENPRTEHNQVGLPIPISLLHKTPSSWIPVPFNSTPNFYSWISPDTEHTVVTPLNPCEFSLVSTVKWHLVSKGANPTCKATLI